MKKLIPFVLLTALSGCDLGSGSKLESLEIVTASGATITGMHQMYPCFRDRLNVIGRFSNGDVGNFSTRVTWSSSISDSNPSNVVRVLNSSEQNTRAVFSNNNGASIGFNDINGLFYTAGTIVPKGEGVETVTASFLGLTASVVVNVNTAAASPIAVSATPVEGAAAPASLPTVVGFSRSLTARAVLGGQTIDAVQRRQDPGTLELMNPILWQFSDNTPDSFEAGRSASTNSLDREDLNVFPFNATRTTTDPAVAGNESATLNPASGTYRAIAASAPTVQAVFDTDATKGVFCPASPITLPAPVEAFVELQLSHETDFNGVGVQNGDLVIGTDEVLKTVANPAGAKQDVSTQVDYEVIALDRDQTVSSVQVSSILSFVGNRLITAPGTNGSFKSNPGIDARFDGDTDVDTVRVRSCAPTPCSTATLFSDDGPANPLSIRAIPASLSAYGMVTPNNPTAQTAFTFDGAHRFSVTASFTATNAVDGCFGGTDVAPCPGSGAPGPQNVSRYMSWLARDSVTAEVSNLLTLFGLYVSTSDSGQTYYLRNPAAATVLDITATPATSTLIGNIAGATTATPPVKATLTVNRCATADTTGICP